jgi:UDP-N-acetylglucosamine--N-acetylmuramyl-(pentapeptide) pyrophosphoryl-undecaprenol N-acetylglucosamine transferase
VTASTERGLRLAIVGGGTGGHVVPGLHMLAALEASDELPPLADLVWFETGRAAEVASMARLDAIVEGCPLERVRVRVEPPSGGAPSGLRLVLRTPGAFLAARRALKAHQSQVVFGLGGFTLLPVVLAARSLRIPVVLLEINAVPGRAVRVLAPFATRILHAWPSSLPADSAPDRQERHRVTGPPLGPAFTVSLDAAEARGEDTWRQDLGVRPDVPLLCVLGGSQGAGALNDFVRESLPALSAAGIAVVHQVGPGRFGEAAPACRGYMPLEFIEDVAGLLASATMALTRAGASTLAEIAAVGLPAMVVPYPGAGGHQKWNAAELEGGLLVVEEPELGVVALERLISLLGPDGERWRAAAAATLRRRVPRDAALEVARELTARAKGS